MKQASALSARYAEAVAYAVAAHQGQVRKGTDVPYISHPLSVSALVLESGGSEDQAIAGLLHDVLEDCGAEHAGPIREQFGQNVLTMVEGLTDGLPGLDRSKSDWKRRKLAYLVHLASADLQTVLVSAADKAHNAGAISSDFAAIGDAVFDRFSSPKSETIWYYRSLAAVLADRLGTDHALVVRLKGQVLSWGGVI